MANVPVNKELYNRVKAEAKKKFKSWPSAYGSAWLVKTYKKRGGKYRSSKRFGGMSDAALDKMQTFYKDMQANKYNPSLMQNSLDDLSYFNAINPRQTYLKKIKEGTKSFKLGDKEITYGGKKVYKGPGLFSKDPYVLDKNINIQTQFGPQGERLYKNIYELDQPGFAPTGNLGYGDDVPEGTQYMMDIYGNDYSVRPPEMKTGGIPERYKNMGFTKVGVKKKSTRPGKKWMVLAKKGDKYKVVHGGDNKMQDFKQHGSAKRKKRFWDRMGGRDSAKAKDPFSPLYWHKRFGTWQEGGQFIYDPNNPMPQFEMGNSILNKMKKETMRKGGQPCYECGGIYNSGGSMPFNTNPNYYGERLEKFIGNVRDTAAENLFPDMEEEVMQMPQARYGMPVYQGDVFGSEVNEDAFFNSVLRGDTYLNPEEVSAMWALKANLTPEEGGIRQTIGNYSVIPLLNGNYAIMYGDKAINVVSPNKFEEIKDVLAQAPEPRFDEEFGYIPGLESQIKLDSESMGFSDPEFIMVPQNNQDQKTVLGPLGPEDDFMDYLNRGLNMLSLPAGYQAPSMNTPFNDYANQQGEYAKEQQQAGEYGLIGGFMLPTGTMTGMGTFVNAAGKSTPLLTAGQRTLSGATNTAQGLGQGALRLNPGPGGRINNLIMPGQGLKLGPGRVLKGSENIGRSTTTNAFTRSTRSGTQGLVRQPGTQGLIRNTSPLARNTRAGLGNASTDSYLRQLALNASPSEVAGMVNVAESYLNLPELGTPAQRWEIITGTPWSEAGDLGLTDGSPESNEELVERLEEGETVEEILQGTEESTEGTEEGASNTGNTSGNTGNASNTSGNASNAAGNASEDLDSEATNYIQGTEGMYTDPNTGMVMNVPQEYFNQQAAPANAQTGMYPQYGSPYLQRARYKYGPLGRNLRRVDLQYGMPGQQMMMPANAADAANATPDNIITALQQAGASNRDIRKAKRAASKQRREDKREARRFNKFVDKYGSPERLVESMQEGAIRGTDRNALMRAMENRGIQPSATEGQRFEGYDLIARPDGEYEYRPTKMYGGSNPYLYMYKQGGEYYMDQDTINMILAMGGDIEFLD